VEHWRTLGLPAYAQFDNDRIFTGAHARPNTIGRVIRLCLSLGVTPRLRRAARARPAVDDRKLQRTLAGQSLATLRASLAGERGRALGAIRSRLPRSSMRRASRRRRRAARFPSDWKLNLRAPLRGILIFLRRTTPSGNAGILGRDYQVSRRWCGRMIRARGRLRSRGDPLLRPCAAARPPNNRCSSACLTNRRRGSSTSEAKVVRGC